MGPTISGRHVGEDVTGTDLEPDHRFELVQSSVPPDGFVDVPVKPIDLLFGRWNALTDGQLAKGVHDGSNVDAVRALTGNGTKTIKP
jgi:hypothetical protein